MNLKDIYNKINNCLDKLYDYEDCSEHIDLVNEMNECIDLLCGFFGVRILKIDIGPLKKDEVIWVTPDEACVWARALDDDNRAVDLLDYPEFSIDDLFYHISK